MKKGLRKFGMFVSGTIFGCSLMLTTVSFADGGIIKFIVNGLDLTPTNGKYNNAPATIVQNGTTYVPIRLVSNMLDVPIKWDGGTRSIIIGDEIKGTYLSDLNPSFVKHEDSGYNGKLYLNKRDFVINERDFGTKGIEIYNTKESVIQYDLNSKYNNLSLYVGIDDDTYKELPQRVAILGDEQVLWEGLLVYGSKPEKIDLNISNVKLLKITVEKAFEQNGGVSVDLAGAILQ